MNFSSLLKEIKSNLPTSPYEITTKNIEVKYWNVFYIKNQVEEFVENIFNLMRRNKINLRLFEIDSEHVSLKEINIPEYRT